MLKWLRNWIGGAEELPQAHMLFVDGENSPPPPDLMMDAVLSHAGCELDLALAWAKWWPTSNNFRRFREAGIECIQADQGSNNADIMLSLRAQREVNERANRGQGGIAYVAFGADKGFSHVLREIKTTKGWKSVYVTSNENSPSILVNSASEVLYIPKSGKPRPTPKKAAAPPIRQPQQIAESSQLSDEKLAEAENLILKLIRNGADNGPRLGQMMIAYQLENGWPDTGKEAFNEKFGFPPNQPYHLSIQQHLSSRVEVSGSGRFYKFELKGAESTELKGADFPLVRGLNHSKSTFSLPRHPHHLGAALIWITENAHLYPTFPEVREQLASETNLSKTRSHKLLTKISRVMGEKDWLTTATSNMDVIAIFDALQTYVYQHCLAKEIEVTEQYSEYFSLARNHISGNTEEE